jgi:hypothetical protein
MAAEEPGKEEQGRIVASIRAEPCRTLVAKKQQELEVERKWRTSFVVFGCPQKYAPDECATFQKMSLGQRMYVIGERQLCLLCMRHLADKLRWSLNRAPNCTIGRCRQQHHEMLHAAFRGREKPPKPGQQRCWPR